MPEPNKNRNREQSPETVDWAEKLRISMENPSEDSSENSSVSDPAEISPEDDELNAIIRASLAQSDRSVSSVILELDTEGFEMEEEISEKPDMDEIEEIPEESDEDEIEEIPEESDEDEIEEIPEESDEDEIEEISEESDEDEIEEIPEESDEDEIEEIFEESDEDEIEEIPEESDENEIEEIPEEFPKENMPMASVPVTPPCVSPVVPPRRERKSPPRRVTYARAISDDRLNGLSPDDAPGGRRLAMLDEENAKLLAEVKTEANTPLTSERTPEPTEVSPSPEKASLPSELRPETAVSSAEDKPRRVPSGGKNAAGSFRDSLQLGLDDVPPVTAIKGNRSDRDTVSVPVKGNPPSPDYAVAKDVVEPEERAMRDTDLHMRLGHEADLTAKEDRMRADRVRERKAIGTPVGGADAVYTHGGREYTGRKDVDQIRRDYTNRRRAAVARFCIAAVGALFGILYDLWGVLEAPVGAVTFTDTPLYPLIGVLWTLLIPVPFLSRLGKGYKSLWRFEPTRYAVFAMALPVSVANGIIAVLAGGYRLFGGVALLMLAVAALSEWMALSGEEEAFSVVSSGKTTYILTDEATPASCEAKKILPEGTRVLTAVPTERVSDPLSRFCRYNPFMGRLNYLLPVALLAAITGAGLAVLRGGSLLYQGIPVFTATYMTCLPSAYLLAMNLPFCLSNRLLRRKGAAVLGTSAASEYADRGKAHLIFSDGDAIHATNRKDVALRGDANAPEWKSLADVLFLLLDTPLAVEPILKGRTLSHYRIDVLEQGEEFIRLHLIDRESEQAIEVMAGAHDAMTRRGIRLPKKNMEMRYKKTDDSHVLYVAFNRRFHLAYSAEYRLGSTFAHVTKSLAALGHGVSLASFDPLLDPDMKEILHLRPYTTVDVLRPTVHEVAKSSRSSGLLATGRSLDLLYPFAACHCMKRSYRLAHLLCWMAVPVSLCMTLAAVLIGREWLLSSAYAVLWQMLSSALITGLCAVAIRPKSLCFQTSPSPKEKHVNSDTTKSDKVRPAGGDTPRSKK